MHHDRAVRPGSDRRPRRLSTSVVRWCQAPSHGADVARVVQFSDTHISHRDGVPPSLMSLLDRLDDDPPDLLVVTGDIVLEDPDDAEDRDYAHAVLTGAPCPVLAIPGNHDVGFYGEDAERPRRVAAFAERWGSDRFAVDVAGWRLVGANAYLLGDAEHDGWLHDAVTVGGPTAVFIHQPQTGGEPNDGWETPPLALAAFESATDGGDIRLIATGHRHRSIHRGPHRVGAVDDHRRRDAATTAPTRHSAPSTTRSTAAGRWTCGSSDPADRRRGRRYRFVTGSRASGSHEHSRSPLQATGRHRFGRGRRSRLGAVPATRSAESACRIRRCRRRWLPAPSPHRRPPRRSRRGSGRGGPSGPAGSARPARRASSPNRS